MKKGNKSEIRIAVVHSGNEGGKRVKTKECKNCGKHSEFSKP